MRWIERDEPWHRTQVDYCEVTGQLLPRRYWQFTHDGVVYRVRDPGLRGPVSPLRPGSPIRTRHRAGLPGYCGWVGGRSATGASITRRSELATIAGAPICGFSPGRISRCTGASV